MWASLPRPQKPLRNVHKTFQSTFLLPTPIPKSTLTTRTQSPNSLEIQLFSLLPWFVSYPYPLQPSTSENPGILNLLPFSPQSNEVTRIYPSWAKALLIFLVIITVLPVPVYFFYTVIIRVVSPVSMIHNTAIITFQPEAKGDSPKVGPRLQARQKRQKIIKMDKPKTEGKLSALWIIPIGNKDLVHLAQHHSFIKVELSGWQLVLEEANAETANVTGPKYQFSWTGKVSGLIGINIAVIPCISHTFPHQTCNNGVLDFRYLVNGKRWYYFSWATFLLELVCVRSGPYEIGAKIILVN